MRWRSPAAGLWVASSDGDYAGVVEQIDDRFHAMDGLGSSLGSFPDLEHARAAVAASVRDVVGAR